ncbi:hypothetical protein Tco_1392056 [Tanacetum coccineum]
MVGQFLNLRSCLLRNSRSGETLQGAEKKKKKVLDVKEIPISESAKFVKEEIEVKQPVLKMSRRKSKARKGRKTGRGSPLCAYLLQNLNLEKLIITSSKIVKWKSLRLGVKDTEYGPWGSKKDLESTFAKNLRIMFDSPQSEDTVWSLPMHIPIVNWRYYDSCNVHCLDLHNSTAIYMLAERSYPLSEEVCSMMLKKKLFAQNTKVKKKLVKSIEKNAGIKA